MLWFNIKINKKNNLDTVSVLPKNFNESDYNFKKSIRNEWFHQEHMHNVFLFQNKNNSISNSDLKKSVRSLQKLFIAYFYFLDPLLQVDYYKLSINSMC